jgi:hypothetical protein
MENYRLPKTAGSREALAATFGADGHRLLQAVEAATDQSWLREMPAIQTLRQVWSEQWTDPPGPLRWRAVKDRAPSAELIASPDDPEARYSTKRDIQCVGYKVHLTETCDEGQPHLITQVITTPATTPDCVMGPTIHHHLAQRDLLPSTHVLDSGYVDAELLLTAQTEHHIDVIGPTFGSYSRQRLEGDGYDLSAFVLDWEAQQARCPQGQTSVKWTPGRDVSGDPVVRIRFDTATCRVCPVRQSCTWAKDAPRQLTVRPQAQHEALSGRKPNTRRSRLCGSGRRRLHSKPSTPSGPGSRGRTRRASDAVVCAGLAIAGSPRRICSICSRPWPSMSSGWVSGGWAHLWPGLAVHPLPRCGWRSPKLVSQTNSSPVSTMAMLMVRTLPLLAGADDRCVGGACGGHRHRPPCLHQPAAPRP